MRKTVLIAGVSMLATALSAQTNANDKFANASERGVKVLLLPPSPRTHEPLRYVLSEPAYVAAFVIYPGSGVRLLYPLINSSERLQRAGYNVDELIGGSFDNDAYNVVLGPKLDGPAYLYVIASRHPLDVARYVHRPMRLASAVGVNDSRSFYADVAFDAIVNNAIALGDDQSWDSDVYTLWPRGTTEQSLSSNSRSSMARSQYMMRVCANGSTAAVPYNYPFLGCPGDVRVRPSAPKPPVQQTASASAAAAAPVATGGAANLVVGSESPTVLPTIVGKRVSDADRREAIAREGAAQRVMYTAANGEQQPAQPAVTVAPEVQLEIIGGHAERRHSADYAEHPEMKVRAPRDGPVVAGSPQLAPNPRLSPNPQLPPAPAVRQAPQYETQQRAVRESMRVPPAPPAAAPPPRPVSSTPAKP